MLKRYNIIDQATLRRGVAKLNAYLDPAKEEALKAGGDLWLTDWTRKVGAKSHAHLRRSVKNARIYAEISGAPAGNRTRT